MTGSSILHTQTLNKALRPTAATKILSLERKPQFSFLSYTYTVGSRQLSVGGKAEKDHCENRNLKQYTEAERGGAFVVHGGSL